MMSNIFAMADTWNAAGTVFTAIQMNVTDTASQATSKLLDLQVGGVSKFVVLKNGFATLGMNLNLDGANAGITTYPFAAMGNVSGTQGFILANAYVLKW